MFFNSLTYIAFFVIACSVYWLIPLRFGRWWLLLASIVFYGSWRVEFLGLIIFTAFLDYYVSLRIHDAAGPRSRKRWLLTSIVINLGMLVYFKYSYFLADNIAAAGGLFDRDWRFSPGDIILPLGISFYTFVSLSYTLDVYRRLQEPVRDFGLYLVYVMFWPHMIAGPILRGHELITQLSRGTRFHAGNAVAGFRSIVTGLFFKVAIADQLAPFVNSSFSANTASLGGIDVWTMAFGFGFQIYFDFAGYSLIAIGSARMLGIHFPENFDWPYLATSARDFWKRWHITLSSWVRDYLYLPLSGARYRDRSDGGIDVQVESTRSSAGRLAFALFLSWFIMGLWHGASWNFAFWGLWHGAIIFGYRLMKDRVIIRDPRLSAAAGWLVTMPVVMLGWIPFRAGTLTQTFEIYEKLFLPGTYARMSFRENYYLLVFLIMAGMVISYYVTHARHAFLKDARLRAATEVVTLAVMMFTVFIFLKQVNQFIYFQF